MKLMRSAFLVLLSAAGSGLLGGCESPLPERGPWAEAAGTLEGQPAGGSTPAESAAVGPASPPGGPAGTGGPPEQEAALGTPSEVATAAAPAGTGSAAADSAAESAAPAAGSADAAEGAASAEAAALPPATGYAPQTTAATANAAPTKPVSMPVLNYHSIGDEPGNTLVLRPEKLRSQMDYLAKNGYTPLSLQDFLDVLEGRKAAPPKPILLTFDDGYADNHDLAMPILQEYGFPAVLFLSPGSMREDWYLNWEQAKALQSAGWAIQPHGMTHPHLPQLSAKQQAEEITEASRWIEEQLGEKAVVFCYPYGEYNRDTLKILEETGFRYAFTIAQGRTTSEQPRFQLKRIYVNGEQSLDTWRRSFAP